MSEHATPEHEPPRRPPERPADRAPPRRPAPGEDVAFDLATREQEAERAADAAADRAPEPDGARLDGGPEAGRVARGLGARAVTIGDSVLFAPGELAPATPQGRRLIAHELAHVRQQRRDGRARIDRQSAPGATSLAKRVGEMVERLQAAQRPPAKTLVTEATTLGKDAVTALQKLKSAKPAASDQALENARDHVKALVRALINVEAQDAGIDLAIASGDAEIQTAAANTVRNSAYGVAGQQSALPHLARLAGEKLSAPTAKQKTGDWLDQQTDAAGRTFRKLEGMGVKALGSQPLSVELAQELMKQLFTKSHANVKPHASGKVSSLAVDKASGKLEADCDVLASYGARLLRAAGWTTVGYCVLIPDPKTGRDAHAVALAKRASSSGKTSDYVGVSNVELRSLGAFASDDKAQGSLVDLALDVYSSPAPSAWKAYYAAAGAKGEYDMKLLDPVKHGLTPVREKS